MRAASLGEKGEMQKIPEPGSGNQAGGGGNENPKMGIEVEIMEGRWRPW